MTGVWDSADEQLSDTVAVQPWIENWREVLVVVAQ